MTDRPLSDTQLTVLRYLAAAERASTKRIYRVTGGTSATLQNLAARGLIEPHLQASYRITALGRAAVA